MYMYMWTCCLVFRVSRWTKFKLSRMCAYYYLHVHTCTVLVCVHVCVWFVHFLHLQYLKVFPMVTILHQPLYQVLCNQQQVSYHLCLCTCTVRVQMYIHVHVHVTFSVYMYIYIYIQYRPDVTSRVHSRSIQITCESVHAHSRVLKLQVSFFFFWN